MTVQLYAGLDPQGRIWAPDYSHEAEAAMRLAGKAWRAFHAGGELLLLAFNLHDPDIDLLAVHERGIGVLEMKAHKGAISFDEEENWFADGKPMVGYRIVPGKERPAASYRNPHQQVQNHGRRLFERLRPVVAEMFPELTRGRRRAMRLQTAVCFTNPEADLAELRRSLPAWNRGRLETWESDFSVIAPEEVPEWLAALRFEVKTIDVQPHYPFRLDPARMEELLTALFPLARWETAERLLPAVRYGCLMRMRAGEVAATHPLWEEETAIGRDPSRCTIVVPPEITRVSRIHAAIGRDGGHVWLKDLDSQNGTYLDGKPVSGFALINDGARISLGTAEESPKGCEYLYREIHPGADEFTTTEDTSHGGMLGATDALRNRPEGP